MTFKSKIIGICSTLCFLCSPILVAQDVTESETAKKYAETITIPDLRDNLNILASDALEGRETGLRGQKMAAAFISSDFETNNLKGLDKNNTNRFYQTFNLYSAMTAEGYIEVDSQKYKVNKDFFYMGDPQVMDEKELSLVFVGQGNESDFEAKDVKGKSILVLNANQQQMRGIIQRADSLGVASVFSVLGKNQAEFDKMAESYANFFSQSRLSAANPMSSDKKRLGSILVSPELVEKLIGKSLEDLQQLIEKNKGFKKVKPKTFKYKIDQKVKTVQTENVAGFIEGTDLKDEVVVVSCHYDHIGITNGEINNGADDDGSGTSAILEMSEAFAHAVQDGHGPRRSLLFIAFTGEEKGLLGSAYYADNPLISLENTIVDLNIDMIGRKDDVHPDNDNYVYLVGSNRLSTQLHDISESINTTYSNLELDYTYNDEKHPERIYYRSDHWNFAKNNVPVIFYTNGFHPDYHKPTDTIDKIEFELLKKRTHLVFYTAWELANRDTKPMVDKKN